MCFSNRISTNVTHDLLNEEEKWREMIHFFLNKAVASVGWMSISQLNVQGLMETEVCVMDGVKSIIIMFSCGSRLVG